MEPVRVQSDLRWAVRSSSVMQAPLGALSSGMLAVTRVLLLNWWAYSDATEQPARRSNTRTLETGTDRHSQRHEGRGFT
ncbi:hypothetical protein EYF80_067710 [Liparis tanakae]|uniref:Uncharacterized protein n=1 Tax=Liparis tanakae TaxID=230148 RepID=A0A4Z2E052_9TELE|nr:hypothetical protein EYF80_067710 [Liparis tanakae]